MRLQQKKNKHTTLTARHLRQTAIRHHSHGTCISPHAWARCAIGRRLSSRTIGLWLRLRIIHHLLRLLAWLLLQRVCVLGLALGPIGIEGLLRAIARAVGI